jgi:hypothetical protein
MGSSSWNNDAYSAKLYSRSTSRTGGFDHDHAVKAAVASGAASKLTPHDKMNPKSVKIRESRDSAAHPESLAIVTFLDVTGSMSDTPMKMVNNLKTLMTLLIQKQYCEHPHIMSGAIGDATSDHVPLQVGQFEAGIEMDDDLERIVMEGNGGGQNTESYELAMYFLARHTSIDCWDKRKEKGFVFIMGDENPYPKIKKNEVKEIIGDILEDDISTEDIVKELQERYHVFMIRPQGTSNFGNKGIRKRWQDLLGKDHVVEIQDIDILPETIAGLIGVTRGVTDVDGVKDDLVSVGSKSVDAVTSAITPYASGKNITKRDAKVEGSLPTVSGGAGIKTL